MVSWFLGSEGGGLLVGVRDSGWDEGVVEGWGVGDMGMRLHGDRGKKQTE